MRAVITGYQQIDHPSLALELHNLGNMNRVSINAISPRPIGWCLYASVALPHCTVTLEAAPKSYLPNPIPLLHPPLCLNIPKLVPQRRRRRVPEPVQRHPGSLHVLRRELEVLLQLVDDGPAAGVDTEVLEGLLEVGDIRLPFVAKDFSANEGEEEKDLLRSRKNKRPNGCDV
jgi:hypothetical protein